MPRVRDLIQSGTWSVNHRPFEIDRFHYPLSILRNPFEGITLIEKRANIEMAALRRKNRTVSSWRSSSFIIGLIYHLVMPVHKRRIFYHLHLMSSLIPFESVPACDGYISEGRPQFTPVDDWNRCHSARLSPGINMSWWIIIDDKGFAPS